MKPDKQALAALSQKIALGAKRKRPAARDVVREQWDALSTGETLEQDVQGRAELAAAFIVGSGHEYADCVPPPRLVVNLHLLDGRRVTYRFPSGLTDARAREIAGRVLETPAEAFA